MKKAKYIVIEGTEGVGKTTQVKRIIEHYSSLGNKVFETKEPGSHHNELTMELRKIMLDASFDLPRPARELISQAIRSIHIEKVIRPALLSNDIIIQDRGILSALAYGEACNNDLNLLRMLSAYSCGLDHNYGLNGIYDKVIVLEGNAKNGLERAKSAKQEFQNGDAMEMKGHSFMEIVKTNFRTFSHYLGNVVFISVDGKSKEEVSKEIITQIEI